MAINYAFADTDGTLAADSDFAFSTQHAVKTYVDTVSNNRYTVTPFTWAVTGAAATNITGTAFKDNVTKLVTLKFDVLDVLSTANNVFVGAAGTIPVALQPLSAGPGTSPHFQIIPARTTASGAAPNTLFWGVFYINDGGSFEIGVENDQLFPNATQVGWFPFTTTYLST